VRVSSRQLHPNEPANNRYDAHWVRKSLYGDEVFRGKFNLDVHRAKARSSPSRAFVFDRPCCRKPGEEERRYVRYLDEVWRVYENDTIVPPGWTNDVRLLALRPQVDRDFRSKDVFTLQNRRDATLNDFEKLVIHLRKKTGLMRSERDKSGYLVDITDQEFISLNRTHRAGRYPVMPDDFGFHLTRPAGFPAICCPMLYYSASYLVRYRLGEHFVFTLFLTEWIACKVSPWLDEAYQTMCL